MGLSPKSKVSTDVCPVNQFTSTTAIATFLKVVLWIGFKILCITRHGDNICNSVTWEVKAGGPSHPQQIASSRPASCIKSCLKKIKLQMGKEKEGE